MENLMMLLLLMTLAVMVFGCQDNRVTHEKHHDTRLTSDISTEQAVREAENMENTPEKLDSGPVERHRETIIQKESDEQPVIH